MRLYTVLIIELLLIWDQNYFILKKDMKVIIKKKLCENMKIEENNRREMWLSYIYRQQTILRVDKM